MSGCLAGKVAIVTGAGGGLGRSIAERFHAEGATVVVADVSGAEEQTAKELGDNAVAVHADVARADDVRALVEVASQTFGRLDVLCNNAGVESAMALTADVVEDDFDRVLAVNLKGVFLGMKYGIAAMLAGGGGSVINIASVGGVVGSPGGGAYVASKHGVIGLTRTAALEYGRMNIRVNAICPGPIETTMLQSLPPEVIQQISAIQPIGRLGQPAEVAQVALLLASDAGSFVTGAAWAVDGGYTAQ